RMVRSIRFSPDGKRLAVVTDTLGLISRPPFNEDIVYIVDVKGGKVFHLIDPFKELVPFAEFLSDGKTLLTRKGNPFESPRQAALWDVATGERRHGFVDLSASACSAAGNLLATGDTKGSIRVSDATGKELRHFKAHDAPVFSLALSPDGKLLA